MYHYYLNVWGVRSSLAASSSNQPEPNFHANAHLLVIETSHYKLIVSLTATPASSADRQDCSFDSVFKDPRPGQSRGGFIDQRLDIKLLKSTLAYWPYHLVFCVSNLLHWLNVQVFQTCTCAWKKAQLHSCICVLLVLQSISVIVMATRKILLHCHHGHRT